MKIALLTFCALGFVQPVFAGAQSPSVGLQPTDSVPAAYALVKIYRAGISSEQLHHRQAKITRANPDTSGANAGARVFHALNGAILGTLGGAAIGGVIGMVIDSHPADDAMIPATPLLAGFGAIVGLVIGTVVGAFWPTK
jgi:hypothetical protein